MQDDDDPADQRQPGAGLIAEGGGGGIAAQAHQEIRFCKLGSWPLETGVETVIDLMIQETLQNLKS